MNKELENLGAKLILNIMKRLGIPEDASKGTIKQAHMMLYIDQLNELMLPTEEIRTAERIAIMRVFVEEYEKSIGQLLDSISTKH